MTIKEVEKVNKDILICGVGGQGTVLASKLIASAAMNIGNIVHSAETIGMAQRGGSVTSHVRIGENAFSPLIPLGKADIIMAFEPSEAVRNLSYLKPDGIVIVNSVPVKPTTDSLLDKQSNYNGTEMINYLQKKCNTVVVDGEVIIKEFKSSKYLNIAMLGVATGTGKLEIDKDVILQEIEKRVPEKFIEMNKKAFSMGYEIGVGNETK